MSDSVELKIVDASGNAVKTKSVTGAFFADASKVPSSLYHQVVRWQRAKKRAGTHSTKTRSEVSGGGSKPWRQKGTGRARAGSNSSPVWIGGGIAHGPHPRKYDFRLNKKERRLALSGAISSRREEGQLIVVDSFDLEEIKTKKAKELLTNIGVNKKALVVIPERNEKIEKSFRNLSFVKVICSDGLNLYDILNHPFLVFIGEEAVEKVDQRLKK